MSSESSRSATRASVNARLLLPVLCALGLAGCNTVAQHSSATFADARGATVAFDSIDGPPRNVFDKLVRDLNAEAQNRRLAIVSRDGVSGYRVRGYLGAVNSPKQSTVSWVWDVYDPDRQRVFRITGEEKIAGKYKDAWQALDDATTGRIARSSIEQLAAFLAASGASPHDVPAAAYGNDASPEAAGIFRIPGAKADASTMQKEMAPGVTSLDQSSSIPAREQRAASTISQIPADPPNGTN